MDGCGEVRNDDTARTFEFLFRFNRVWINSRLLLLFIIIIILMSTFSKINQGYGWLSTSKQHKVDNQAIDSV